MFKKVFDLFKANPATKDENKTERHQPAVPVILKETTLGQEETVSDLSKELWQYQEELGDNTTLAVFNDKIPIQHAGMPYGALFHSHPVIYGLNNRIEIADRVKDTKTKFLFFSHEARHYTQYTTQPNFYLIGRVVPEKLPFTKRVCELDAYLYESEKTITDYIKTKDDSVLKNVFDESGYGIEIYAQSMGKISFGKSISPGFKNTKDILDRFAESRLTPSYLQKSRALFCQIYAQQKPDFENYDYALLIDIQKAYKGYTHSDPKYFVDTKNDIFNHSPKVSDAEKLLYRDDPDKHFLNILNTKARQEFWHNMHSCSAIYHENLPRLKRENEIIRNDVKQRFG